MQRVQPQSQSEPQSLGPERPERGQRHLAGGGRFKNCLRLIVAMTSHNLV